MKTVDFQNWLTRINGLTPSQREQATERLNQEQSKAETTRLTSSHPTVCPHCHQQNFVRWGNANDLPRFRCKVCDRTFNTLTGTPFARLRHRELWSEYARTMIRGESVRTAARCCGIDKNTAFRWRHRFLSIPAQLKPSHLHGIVEADETYFLESFKGSRHLMRPPRKRGGKAAKRGLSSEQVPVLIARDRTRATTDAVLSRASTQAVRSVLESVIDHDAILCSDGSPVFVSLAKKLHIAHQPVNVSAGIRVINHAFHIQNVNAYDSRLKGWMARFHGVATKNLPNYLGWRRCIEYFGNRITPELFLTQGAGGITYT